MSTKSFTGTYCLVLDPIAKTKQIPDTIVDGEAGQIKLASNAMITTEADTQEQLSITKMAALFSAHVASGWLPFGNTEAEFENGTRLPITVGVRMLKVDKFEINGNIYGKTAKILLALDADTISFLMRALELESDRRNELAALNALLGLDLHLSRIVPQRQFWSWGARIALLDFLHLLSSDSFRRLKGLSKLRDALAHGDWTSESVGDSLNVLLEGGREKWLHNGRISTPATRKVIKETISAMDDLVQSKERLGQLLAQIIEPTEVDKV